MLRSIFKEVQKKRNYFDVFMLSDYLLTPSFIPCLSLGSVLLGTSFTKHPSKERNCWKLKDRKRGELSIFSLPFSGVSPKCCIFTVISGLLENPSSWSQLPQIALGLVQFQLDGPSLEIPLSTGFNLWEVPHLLCISEAPLQTVLMSKSHCFSIRTLIMISIFPNVYNSKIYIYIIKVVCVLTGDTLSY